VSLVTRFVVGVDVEKFSSRNANQQIVIQRELDRMLTEAALNAGLDRAAWECRAEGDGEVAVLPADVDLLLIVRRFVVELDSLLTDHNEHHQANTRIRLRVAMHLDSITWGRLGYAGEALIVLSRLLDSPPVRTALESTAGVNLVQIISEDVFKRAVLPEVGGIKERHFRKVLVDLPAKGFRQNAYLYVSGGAAPVPPQPQPEPAPQTTATIFDHIHHLPHPPWQPQTEQRSQPPKLVPPKNEVPVLSPQVRELLAELRVALHNGELMRADALTTRTLVEAGEYGHRQMLRTSDAANLPDTLFTEVDAPWAEHSGGRWGFAAQRKHLADIAVSNRRHFHDLSLALGWRRTSDGIAPPYADFVAAGNTDLPFYPTLRQPSQEKNPNWYDEWVTTSISIHTRLHSWT
jgi:GUN4-like